ncbi:PLD nuclease N-terminal domain-containing protein [Acidiferrobacter thiooxydans]|jgi:hypothetical protein|uniref:Uncharacterized protein n=1 Tax=Acidiferrobacter thiooxydans TaxID=163359 RepID=A0A1C2G2V5_9GAMM|nr:PLD nuclease N-terminal domain-containing protein [Acidiferrobacter thiooxydans]RCN59188.1 hypothetical protein C4900_05575 [Acidiferrobacter thiooxydans]UEO00918.1 PLD nuclease N-terminal domain-containing protein [Acidiferrobacter thiooxydans]
MGSYSLLGTVIVVLDVIAIISILLGSARIGHKVLWIVVVLVFPLVGMIVYYLVGRSPRDV